MLDSIKIQLEEWALQPVRAHEQDAGMDLRSPKRMLVEARGGATIDTGVRVQIPEGYAGFLKSKSGLNVNHGIVSEGVIDAGYSGTVVVRLHNLSDVDYVVQYGDKITQMVIQKVETPRIEIVEKVSAGERGDNGFGSTGR